MKLYVGNLSFQTQENELADLFSEVGELRSAKVCTEPQTGRSRGFGFVEFVDSDAGQQAISKFDGFQFDGRNIKVSEAKERTDRGPGGGGGHRRSGGGGGYGGGGGGGGYQRNR